MINNIYYITKIASNTSTSEVVPARTFKGDTNVVLDFSNIIETDIKLIKVKIDFNDGTVLEKNYSSKESLFDQVQYLFTPSENDYLITRICNITLTFSNFTTHFVIIPINIAQCSFLSEYGALTVKKAQFIDNINTGDMFLILESEKHNLYNVNLKIKTFTTVTSTVTSEDTILVTNNDDPIVTNFSNNIKVQSVES